MAEGDNPQQPGEPVWQFRPGETITPGGQQSQAPANEPQQAPVPPTVPLPPPNAQIPQAVAPPPAEPSQTEPLQAPTEPPQQPETLLPHAVAVPPSGPEGSISWTASEFVAHQKSAGWYLLLALAAAAASAIVWFLTKGIVSVVVILVGAAFLGVYGAHEPRQLSYQLDESGLTIGDKHYDYSEFRSFAVLAEGAFSSIVFTPLKRFMPLTSIYYAPEDEDKIVALLSARLPFEEHRSDAVDRLMHRIRF